MEAIRNVPAVLYKSRCPDSHMKFLQMIRSPREQIDTALVCTEHFVWPGSWYITSAEILMIDTKARRQGIILTVPSRTHVAMSIYVRSPEDHVLNMLCVACYDSICVGESKYTIEPLRNRAVDMLEKRQPAVKIGVPWRFDPQHAADKYIDNQISATFLAELCGYVIVYDEGKIKFERDTRPRKNLVEFLNENPNLLTEIRTRFKEESALMWTE